MMFRVKALESPEYSVPRAETLGTGVFLGQGPPSTGGSVENAADVLRTDGTEDLACCVFNHRAARAFLLCLKAT